MSSHPRARWSRLGIPILLAIALLAAACGGSSSPDSGEAGGGGDDASTLRMALAATVNADPDVYFLLEGIMVTNSVYEGLVAHVPGSTDIVGLIAESWEISDDGLTYTFTLRDGVTFADGTPVTSEAVQASFERRLAVAQAPSYMLLEVASYETPDPATFVVNLSVPVNNFLYRLASPWGPKVTNPAVIEANAVGDDLAQDYLLTNSAGTGPYVISESTPDVSTVLTVNENYWGDAPGYDQVIFNIIPDATAQRLQVEAGDLDIVHSIGTEASQAIEEAGELQVVPLAGFNMNFWQINITEGPLSDVAVRRALWESLPIETMVPEVFGDYATVAEQMIPAGRMPEEFATLDREFDPDALTAAVAALPDDLRSVPVVVGSPTIDNGELQRQATVMAQTLEAAGLTVELTKVTDSQYFSYFGAPEGAPSLLVYVQPDDGAHPDNWFRLFLYSVGALSYGGIGSPESDALMDEANAVPPNEGIPYELYSQASDLLREQVAIIPMADVPTVWIASPDVTGLAVQLAGSQGLVIPLLEPAP
jgi:peptide/nickel transport system substrate-binding protein